MKKVFLGLMLVCVCFTVLGFSSVAAEENINYGYLERYVDAFFKSEYELDELSDVDNAITVLARAGKVKNKTKRKYYKAVQAYVEEKDELSVSEISRIAGAINALGYKNKVGKKDILNDLYDLDFAIGKNETQEYDLYCVINSLRALDLVGYAIPKEYTNKDGEKVPSSTTREALVKILLEEQAANGSWIYIAWDGPNTVDIDTTAMALQALAKQRQASDPVVQNAFAFLQSHLNGRAGYESFGSDNSCTTAQVILAVNAFGLDVTDPENGFMKDCYHMAAFLDQFAVTEGADKDGYTISNGPPEMENVFFATTQVLMAKNSQRRVETGAKMFYDMTDTGFNYGTLITLGVFSGLIGAAVIGSVLYRVFKDIKKKRQDAEHAENEAQ